MGNDGSKNPSISDDGNLIAFASPARNLIDGGGVFVLYLENMATGSVRMVGQSGFEYQPGGAPEVRTAISGRARVLAYERLVFSHDPLDTIFRGPVMVTDLRYGGEHEVGLSPDPEVSSTALHPSISDDGTYLAFDSDASDLVPDDPDGPGRDVFRTNLRTGSAASSSPIPRGSYDKRDRRCDSQAGYDRDRRDRAV